MSTGGDNDLRQKLLQERFELTDSDLHEVVECVLLRDGRWAVPDPDTWTISCGETSPSDCYLKLNLLSPEVPLYDLAWFKEYQLILDALSAKFEMEAIDNHSMHVAVQGAMGYDQFKMILKLFCVFEDIIDGLHIDGDTSPVDSVQHNRVLASMHIEDVLAKINSTQNFGKLCLLLIPNFLHLHDPSFTCKIYPKLHMADGFTLFFNNPPTSLRPNDIVLWMVLIGKFAQHAVNCSDDEIVHYRPSLDVFFDEIIQDEALAKRYDPRCSRIHLPSTVSKYLYEMSIL
ncbi:hypothetical protein OBBRIDRAFT_808810 [Obba rivulosa]|uniref:Uncharacterized protein n=1 Tax=Obba rivulosa TaxID=1052685 RepID=A0A8E2AJY9_9APHY|nr:hypothetical protein OBBRIDRAFT_808810 [Obba rivulosa]